MFKWYVVKCESKNLHQKYAQKGFNYVVKIC